MRKVYVIGAGFSRDAGLPLISDFNDTKFLSKLLTVVRNRKESVSRFNEAKSVLTTLIEGNIISDIEDALGYLSCMEYLGIELEISGSDNVFPEVHKGNVEWLITQAVSLRGKRRPQAYEKFFKKVGREKSTIISFNYDLLPEQSAKSHGREFDYGFSDEYENERGSLPLLLKLHGSVDWIFCRHCGLQILYGLEVAIMISKKRIKCPECMRFEGLEPVIIPPIIGKEHTIDRFSGGKRNMRDVWRLAMNKLAEAEKVIFIGYSFRDIDVYARNMVNVTYFLSRKDPTYIIINPDIDVIGNYRKVLPKVKLTHEPHGFKDTFRDKPRLF
jgi:NAD-dependent SIR2 family protein deacetylase